MVMFFTHKEVLIIENRDSVYTEMSSVHDYHSLMGIQLNLLSVTLLEQIIMFFAHGK